MTMWGKYGSAEPDGADGGDLAQQAAGWVPPWARQPEPAPQEEAETVADGETDADGDGGGETDIDSDVDTGVAAVADAVPVPHPRQAERVEPATSTDVAEDVEPDFGAGLPSQPASALAVAPPGLSEADLIPALEAIMLVVDEPVSEITLSQVLDVPAELIAGTLIDLSASYTRQGRGFDLRRAAGGWRLYTRSEYAPYVERFVLDGQQMRLTQASLETLAVVAYKQPVTRSRISAIRGVNCDGVIRTLITRGMVEECGTDPESGAYLYRTTTLFLEKLGLDSVDELPSLAPFLPDNIEEIADEQR